MNPLILITPTYHRPHRLDFVRRCIASFQPVEALTWLVVEDGDRTDWAVSCLLEASGIVHQYWSCGPTRRWGNAQRNSGMCRVVDQSLRGVVYLADDDNRWDPRLFPELRRVDRVGILPVGNLGPRGVERPVVSNGRFVFWDAGWLERRFPVDMAGFAFHSEMLKALPRPYWEYQDRGGETEFLSKLVKDESEFDFLCNECLDCYVWHNAPL